MGLAAAPAGHLVAVAKDRASAYLAGRGSRSSRLATRGMVRRLVAALVGMRIGCYSHLSLGLGILRLMGSSQEVGAARYVVVAVARAAERASAWPVASLVVAHAAAGLAAVVARQSVALNVHGELDSGYSVVAAEVKAHSHYSKASPALALVLARRFRSAARLEARCSVMDP